MGTGAAIAGSAAVGGISSIIAGIIGSNAAREAGSIQEQAALADVALQSQGLDYMRSTTERSRNDALPWMESGRNALDQFMVEMGLPPLTMARPQPGGVGGTAPAGTVAPGTPQGTGTPSIGATPSPGAPSTGRPIRPVDPTLRGAFGNDILPATPSPAPIAAAPIAPAPQQQQGSVGPGPSINNVGPSAPVVPPSASPGSSTSAPGGPGPAPPGYYPQPNGQYVNAAGEVWGGGLYTGQPVPGAPTPQPAPGTPPAGTPAPVAAIPGATAPATQPMGVGFQKTPGYDFEVKEGERGVLNNLSAMGMKGSGAALKALTRFRQGTANQSYGNYLTRLWNVATGGQNQTNETNALSMNGAGGIMQGLRGIGQGGQDAAAMRASGFTGGANAWTGALGNIANNTGSTLGWLSQYRGQGA